MGGPWIQGRKGQIQANYRICPSVRVLGWTTAGSQWHQSQFSQIKPNALQRENTMAEPNTDHQEQRRARRVTLPENTTVAREKSIVGYVCGIYHMGG